MKYIFKIPVLLFLLPLLGVAGKIEKVYLFDPPTVKNIGVYSSFSFGKTLNSAKPGEPAMPYQQVKLLLPPGESATEMQVEFSGLTMIAGSYKIYPQQFPQSFSDKNKSKFSFNKEVYSRSSNLPDIAKGKLTTSFLNGKGIAISSFTPLRYNPALGTVSYYTSVKVTITTKTDERSQKALKIMSSGNQQVVEDYVDNPAASGLYKSFVEPLAHNYEMLIITSSTYSSAFSPLTNAYLRQGLRSQIATVEIIGSTMTGIDLPEKIRNYIIQEYTANGFAYLLLGGDIEIVPARGLYGHVVTGPDPETNPDDLMIDLEIPADIYYAALDGTWDFDTDGIWGEPADIPIDPLHPDEADLFPELAVARFPFGDLSELNTLIHKSLSYQLSPVDGEFRNQLFVGETLYDEPEHPEWQSYGSDYLDLLIGYQNENYYETTGVPENYVFDKLYSEVEDWDGFDVINHIDMGRPMIHHLGHTNPYIMMSIGSWELYDENFPNTNGVNHNYPIVYSQGCDAGAFDYSLYFEDCIGEYMVLANNFASAFVGNSRFGWFYAGVSEGPSEHLHREFVDALFSDHHNRIGRAHMESKIETAPWASLPGQEEAMRWVIYDNMVFGDPAMAVYTDNPYTVAASFPTNLGVGATSIQITVNAEGNPLINYKCVVLENENLIGMSNSNSSGISTISLSPAIVNPNQVELIISGENIVPTSYQLQPKTYTWNVASGNWKTPLSWTPARTVPAANDILIFDGTIKAAPNVSLDFTSDENIGKLKLLNNANVTLNQLSNQRNMNIGTFNVTAPHFEIGVGSQFNIQGINAMSLNINNSCIAEINGNMGFSGAPHRLTGAGINAITFNSGAIFTAGNNFSGHAFGSATANSVLFKNGSKYIQQSGDCPFGLTAPSSVVVFETGSNYKFKNAIGAPEISGRTYGNLEIDSGSSDMNNITGEGNLTFQDITITTGSFGLTLNGALDLKGDLNVASGTSFSINPSSPANITLNGTEAQQIGGTGTIVFGINSTLIINNPLGVLLNKRTDIPNLIINSGNFTIND